ncbi:unnamed protein product [Dovyalis caffra]|uniref:Uncharacterized protein n=1 Tax=Dovyalis caffra TaxID=77055 RepID=A0AAV1SNQ2_9ROSI|nr:unnamed protein product [Dovyalis caffra]
MQDLEAFKADVCWDVCPKLIEVLRIAMKTKGGNLKQQLQQGENQQLLRAKKVCIREAQPLIQPEQQWKTSKKLRRNLAMD